MRATATAGMFLLVYLLSGCATYNTAQHIRPWGDNTRGFDRVERVTDAWREATGDIRVCVRGDPAERPYTTAILFDDVNYSFLLPVSLYESAPESAPKLHRTKDPVPEFNLTAGDVQGSCGKSGAYRARVEVRRIHPAELGVESFVYADYAARQRLFDAPPAGPVVFEFVEDPSSTIYYRGLSPAFDGSQIVEIDQSLREKEPRPGWILALPFALVFDIATSPVQLFICVASSGCAL